MKKTAFSLKRIIFIRVQDGTGDRQMVIYTFSTIWNDFSLRRRIKLKVFRLPLIFFFLLRSSRLMLVEKKRLIYIYKKIDENELQIVKGNFEVHTCINLESNEWKQKKKRNKTEQTKEQFEQLKPIEFHLSRDFVDALLHVRDASCISHVFVTNPNLLTWGNRNTTIEQTVNPF